MSNPIYYQYMCVVCGFVYDEAKGFPEKGIPHYTLWKDVPEYWLCPDCKVGKGEFERVEPK